MSTSMGDSVHSIKQRSDNASVFSFVYVLFLIESLNIISDKTYLLAGCFIKICVAEIFREIVAFIRSIACITPTVQSFFLCQFFQVKTNRVQPDSYFSSYRKPLTACQEMPMKHFPFQRKHQRKNVHQDSCRRQSSLSIEVTCICFQDTVYCLF